MSDENNFFENHEIPSIFKIPKKSKDRIEKEDNDYNFSALSEYLEEDSGYFNENESDENNEDYMEKNVNFLGEFEYDYCLDCSLKNDWEHNCQFDINSDSVILNYQKEEQESCPFKKYRFEIIKSGNKNVADGIGEKYKNWKSEIPVFISAQTGGGKNYFTEEVLIEYLWKLYDITNNERKILILSNRIALRKQIKNRIEDDGLAKAYSYQSFLDKSDILKKQQRDEKKKYLFVICDEAHFFTSDSMFNPYTNEILNEIIETFQNAVRIYMTATPYLCIREIAEKENLIEYDELWELNKNHRTDLDLINSIDDLDEDDDISRRIKEELSISDPRSEFLEDAGNGELEQVKEDNEEFKISFRDKYNKQAN